MAGLRALLESRASPFEENNLEKGKMWAYSNVATYSTYPGCFCWISPGTGTVEIEVFGAGGGGSECVVVPATISVTPEHIPKKTITVVLTCWICGLAGKSCLNGGLCPEVVQNLAKFVGKVIVETTVVCVPRWLEWC